MKAILTTVCYLCSISMAASQIKELEETKCLYDWRFVYDRVKKSKNGISDATKLMVREIASSISDNELQQLELIKLYSCTFDFKIVDKVVLSGLIDSLMSTGTSDLVKKSASQAKNAVEYRLLNKPIGRLRFVNKNNDSVSLDEVKRKYTVVELWATWCAPCIREMSRIPVIRNANPSVEFYSISLDKSFEKMKRHISKKQYDWPIVWAGDKETNPEFWDYLNIVAIPKYYIIDQFGIVVKVSDHLEENYIAELK